MENKTKVELALEAIRKGIKGSKIVEAEGNTGWSFFEGKDRLGKVLKTKKGFVLEINVVLPETVEKQFVLQPLLASVAQKKHLGTMKYHPVRTIDDKEIPILIAEMIKAFKAVQTSKAKEA